MKISRGKFENYPKSWHKMARIVKKLSRGKCENCGRRDDRRNGYVLTVHHIDFNKLNNNYSNLVALCQRCHLSIQSSFHLGQLWLFDVKPEWAKIRGL